MTLPWRCLLPELPGHCSPAPGTGGSARGSASLACCPRVPSPPAFLPPPPPFPTSPDSETGEDEPSDPQVTQRSELQDETAFSTPTGEQGAPGWHRAPAPAAGHSHPARALAGPALGISGWVGKLWSTHAKGRGLGAARLGHPVVAQPSPSRVLGSSPRAPGVGSPFSFQVGPTPSWTPP